MRVRGFLFTFRCFSSELWVKAERVIWFACCRFKWGLELSPVEFLHRYKLKKSKEHRGLFKVCEHMWNWSQDPFQVNPLPIPLQPGPAKSILLALKHSHQAISAHTARTGCLPRHTQTQLAWPRLMASIHQANHLLGVNSQHKLENYSCSCMWETSRL